MLEKQEEKLQRMFTKKFLSIMSAQIANRSPRGGKKSSLERTISLWDELCRELGVERTKVADKDKITLTDPSPGGTYLQMDPERAILILTIGLP